MAEAVRSEPFHELAAALKAGGHAQYGSRLEDVLNGTWTTSTELIGELGLVVLAIRNECRPLNPEQKTLATQCIREVRKAWPGFGWSGWRVRMFGWLR